MRWRRHSRVWTRAASGWRSVPAAWQVNQWLKKAVLLSFRLNDMTTIPGGPVDPSLGASVWFDKVPSKFAGWDDDRFREPVSAPCRARWSAAPPISRPASC